MPKSAIVTTIRNTGASLLTFLDYHLHIGFDHIFIFCDDPNDAALPLIPRSPQISVCLNDETLRAKWQNTPIFQQEKYLKTYLDEEVMARQILNTAVAIEIAQQKGFDWLLHIDADELFYLHSKTVPAHFQELDDKEIKHITYLNLECAPELSNGDNFFEEVTLFKTNESLLPGEKYPERQKTLEEWKPQWAPNLFHFYNNGKSAVRLAKGVQPSGVHDFSFSEGRMIFYRLKRRIAKTKWGGKLIDIKKLPASGRKSVVSKNPLILHYACANFDAFWRKYATLGKFSDKWFDRSSIEEKIGKFHLKSRDVVAKDNKEEALDFYNYHVVISEKETIQQLQEMNMLQRINEPAKMINGLRRSG